MGGPTPFARAEDSYVVRAGERIELDAAALWDGNTLTGDIPLQPRDQLVVPATEVFVTVLGEVNRPGVVPFQFGLTVSDYLLRSGGITREADAGLIHFVDKTGRSLRAAKLDAPGAQRGHPDRRTPSDPAPAGRHPAHRPHRQPLQQHRHRHQHGERLDRPLPVVRPARPVSEPPVETNAAEVGLAVCRYLSTLATRGYLSGCWMRSMSKSTSRSGQWKCPSRSE